MKRLVGCALILGILPVTFLCGVYYGDWAVRQRVVTVDLSHAKRLKDGEHEYSRLKSEEGLKVYVVWKR